MSTFATSVCAEIQYMGADGSVHSDICPPEHTLDPADTEWRALLHACLDEWIDRSGGTGHFVVRDSNDTA